MKKEMTSAKVLLAGFLATLLATLFLLPTGALAATASMVTYHADPGKFAAEQGQEPSSTYEEPMVVDGKTVVTDKVPTNEVAGTYIVKLVFDGNGGVIDGKETKEGANSHSASSTFKEWNDAEDKSGKVYKAGDEITFSTEGLDLYAVYTASEKVTADKFPEADRDGYVLTGWYDAKEGGKLVGKAGDAVPEDAEPAEGAEEVTYYAQWAKAYTVKFMGKDGKEELKTEKVAEGEDATAPEAPKVEGFEFTGWDKDFTKVKEDLTVTALYKEVSPVAVKYKALFDGNGATGTNDPAAIEFEAGASIVLPQCTLKRDGYSFAGWSLSKDGSSKTYAAGTTLTGLDPNVKADGTVTFYAQWKGNGFIPKTGDFPVIPVVAGIGIVALLGGAVFFIRRREQ